MTAPGVDGATPGVDRTIRAAVVDDQELVRRGFRALLEAEPGIDVVGEGATGHEAVRLAIEHRPDVVLMDIRMPDLDGIEATRRIAADERLTARVLILTTFDLDAYVYDALRAGASGFLLKDAEPARLLDAIRVVAAGDALLDPSITGRLIAEFADRVAPTDAASRLDPLTDREREVLAEVGRGRTNAEIGEALIMSPLTAKTHVSRILAKLGVRDRAQLVVVAYETGLVVPGRG